ncbi:TetR family transcriptional regulator [Marisediminicola senii]|uniref:TetR family transcriptional regulator n=1 Tax=Marisediminicola senii TaxID=2711233 RepID=UPI0013EDF786|nr:TetR family transcriptional regulator [Marisediminicola senii]
MKPAGAGRPRLSSRQMLQSAAEELFFEKGYAATTVDDITRRAGVGRSTFFNYFPAKSDLLWVELDAAIDRLADELAAVPPGAAPLAAVRDAALRVAADIGLNDVPLALTQDDVMGTREETRSSGLARLALRSDVIAGFLARQCGGRPDDLAVLAAANALSGAISAAWTAWAREGIGRGPLLDYMTAAIDIVSRGLEESLV